MKAEKMDPVRAKAISIVLLHFWPLFCQRAVCHDSLSLSLPLSLPFSPLSLFLSLVSGTLSILLSAKVDSKCNERQKPNHCQIFTLCLSLLSPPPFLSSSPQLVMENLHNTLCNYERDNATSTPLSFTCSLSRSPHADVASVASRLYF